MWDILWDSLKDASIDTLKMLPILYLAYLLVSYFSHNHQAGYTKFMKKSKKFGPLVGSFLGCVPQCGFSSLMSDFYAKKEITLGTLIAVFIATSDEAIPIMVSNYKFIVPMLILIGIKLVFAVLYGYGIDLITLAYNKIKSKKTKNISTQNNNVEVVNAVKEDCECDHNHDHEHKCDCGHKHKGKHHCCAENIFLDALKHTALIALYVFIATLVINIVIGFVGVESLTAWFGNNVYIQIVLACLIGLIPNCAASVCLVELFMAGGLGFAALAAGLSTGAGVGLIILFIKNRKKIWQNISVMGIVYSLGVITGVIVSLFERLV